MEEQWLSVGAAAAAAGVDPGTIRRWADNGKLFSRRTPAGHRRIAAGSLRSSMSRSSVAVLPADVYELSARLRDIVDTLAGLDLDLLADDEREVLASRLCGRFGSAAELTRLTEKLSPSDGPTPSSPSPTSAPASRPADVAPTSNPLFDRLDRHIAARAEKRSAPLTAEDAKRLLFSSPPARRPLLPEDFDEDDDD